MSLRLFNILSILTLLIATDSMAGCIALLRPDASAVLTKDIQPVVESTDSALVRLMAANRLLEHSRSLKERLSIEQLAHQGFVQLGSANVKPIGQNEATSTERLSVVEVLVPFAHTGFYVDDFSLSPQERQSLSHVLGRAYRPGVDPTVQHQGLMMYFPGNGSMLSQAKTVVQIASTFSSKGKSRGRSSPAIDPNYRLAGFMVDLPGNGMGLGAPKNFLSEEGLREVVRHVRLILWHLYGDTDTFIGGRSHGGIASLIYGNFYNDVQGVVAMSALFPEKQLCDFMYENMEDPEISTQIFGQKLDLHLPSHEASREYLYGYHFHHQSAQVPQLLLIGDADPTYGQFNRDTKKADLSSYLAAAQKYQAQSPLLRSSIIYSGANHNLWDRGKPDLYKQVVMDMADFFKANRRAR